MKDKLQDDPFHESHEKEKRTSEEACEEVDLSSKQSDSEQLDLKLPSTNWDQVQFFFPQPYIKFGKGVVEEIPKAVFKLLDPMITHIKKAQIQRPKLMLIIGSQFMKNSGYLDKIIEACKRNAIDYLVYSIESGEATVTMVDEGLQIAIEEKPHYIAGIGGGSVLDTAKAIAGIYTNGGIAEDYHDGKPFEIPGLPFIAVPTTAGTGSEITNNAVLIDKNRGFKKSIRGDQIIAKYILLDPELTLSCPPSVTAYSGTDALVQAIEAFVSKNSHPLADIYAEQAIRLISYNLKEVYDHGENFEARSEIMLGAFYAGIAFSNVGLGLVHGLAHPIGYKYQIPHGKICGCLLPWVIQYNMEYRPNKYAHIAQMLNKLDLFTKYEPEAEDIENAKRLTSMIKEIFSQVQIPLRLQDLGVKKEDFNWIVEHTKGGSVEANPRPVDKASLHELLHCAW